MHGFPILVEVHVKDVSLINLSLFEHRANWIYHQKDPISDKNK